MSIVYTGEKDPRAYKSVIGAVVKDIIESDPKACWLDADLMSCSGTNGLLGKTDRVINCGIAEANMIGIAAGMAATGLKVYAHSFGCFASRRCFDQVFLSAGYAKNPLTVIGTDPGVTAAFNGGTHMPFEDTALYRTIPTAVIWDITDVSMLKAALTMGKDMEGVKYIRVPRKDSYPVYSEDHEFVPGKGCVIREGTDVVIVASGIMVHEALQAAKKLEGEGVSCAVIDPITVKPLDVELIRSYVEKCGKIVVAENHNRVGGLVSAVAEAIVGMPCKFGYAAVEDTFGEVGPQNYLQKVFGMTAEHVEEVVKNVMA